MVRGRARSWGNSPGKPVPASQVEAAPPAFLVAAGSQLGFPLVLDATDSSGRFVLSGLLPGPYQVEVSGFAGESDRVLVEAVAAHVELHLGRLGTVEEQTTDERGSPAPGCGFSDQLRSR